MSNTAIPTGRIVIAESTGFLGLKLTRCLANYSCVVLSLSRHRPTDDGPWTHAVWDGRTLDNWAVHLEDAASLVNLAGRSVDCIKTPDHCDEILGSRVEATGVLRYGT